MYVMTLLASTELDCKGFSYTNAPDYFPLTKEKSFQSLRPEVGRVHLQGSGFGRFRSGDRHKGVQTSRLVDFIIPLEKIF